MRRVKRPREQLVMTDSVGQHRSDYQLSVADALRQSTGVVSDSFFESDRTASEAVGSVVYGWIFNVESAFFAVTFAMPVL